MSPLQWALLILAVAAVVAVYWVSRRDRKAMREPEDDPDAEPLLPPDQQLDIFDKGVDEFGVGKPRRIPPKIDTPPRLPDSATGSGDEPEGAGSGAIPVRQGVPPTSDSPAAPDPRAAASEQTAAAQGSPEAEQKIVSVLVAGRSGRTIDGPRLHKLLRAQGLEYGDRRIYHCQHAGRAVFSVASLVKPGYLDPAEAEGFSTPGLALFLTLPGPLPAGQALGDMLATARALAAALGGQVFDHTREPMTEGGARALANEVEAWTRRRQAATR